MSNGMALVVKILLQLKFPRAFPPRLARVVLEPATRSNEKRAGLPGPSNDVAVFVSHDGLDRSRPDIDARR